jgi:hypothetical protein
MIAALFLAGAFNLRIPMAKWLGPASIVLLFLYVIWIWLWPEPAE